jgi:hypothetical protein
MPRGITEFSGSLPYTMVEYAYHICTNTDFEVNTDRHIYPFDSFIISLYLSVFWWASRKRNAGVIKIHTLLDVKMQGSGSILITHDSIHNIKAMGYIPCEQNSFYIFDKSYNSFADLYRIFCTGAFFPFRVRGKLKFRWIYPRPCNRKSVKCDQIGVFTTDKSHGAVSRKTA